MSDSIVQRAVFNVFRFSLFGISITLFAIAYFFKDDSVNINDWQMTKAKIFKSQVVQKQTTIYGRNAIYYDLDISYAYIVNKKRYDQKGLFGSFEIPKTLTKEYFVKMAGKYQAGSMQKVHYDPENPKNVYLEKPKETGIQVFYDVSLKMLIASISLFLITPVLFIINGIMGYKKDKKIHEFIIPEDAKRIKPSDRRR